MSDKPHDMAVRSPWTEGAWIIRDYDLPRDWVWHYQPDEAEWWPLSQMHADGTLVEARPSGGDS